MLNSRAFLLLGLILFVAFSTNYLLDQDSEAYEAPEVMAQNDPDLYMLDPDIIQFNADGRRQHKINAERLTHYPLTDITTLQVPNITLYSGSEAESIAETQKQQQSDQTGASPWDITAKHGRLLPKVQLRDQIVELWQQVLAIQIDAEGNFVHIQTEALTVFPDRDYAETDQKVYIDNNTGRTVAGGMRAYFEKNKFIFLSSSKQRVQTILLPKFTTNNDAQERDS